MSKSLEKMIADERKRIQAKILELVERDKQLQEHEDLLKPKPFDPTRKLVLEKAGEEDHPKPTTFKEAMAKAAEYAGEK